MESEKSPIPCPNTVTIRRNPHRRARPTPSSTNIPNFSPSRNPNLTDIPSFPLDEILKFQLPENPQLKNETATPIPTTIENLKVFLRIRPLSVSAAENTGNIGELKSKAKNAWPVNPRKKVNAYAKKGKCKSGDVCVVVNNDQSVTVSPPSSLVESKRNKAEVFKGFSRVFSPSSSQNEVYESMMKPIVEEFLRGNSGMLAALGPSGSGKTHTVFGSAREPGVVPLTLREIFKNDGSSTSKSQRLFLLSMFEIRSEGKGEKIFDLCSDGVGLGMHQSTLKGLQKVVIKDIREAESIIACGMLKRSTAFTNMNSQSSRSQCVINIHNASAESDCESGATLTIVDLAGAEREKRTGNQGSRLHESNFINNTSMVFGLCLRSLLEHQKNPKKPLQKHFQYSMLTRYLQDYLEGKKRMALILTVKPGEGDYLDTSFLLRHASRYMNIQFHKVEESKSLGSKRHIETFPRVEQKKRIKSIPTDVSTNEERKNLAGSHLIVEEGCCSGSATCNFASQKSYTACSKDTDRNNKIMQNFAKALWKVLKEYKEKLKVAESEIQDLKENLAYEKTRCLDLENEVKGLKASCNCSSKNLENITSAEVISSFKSEVDSLVEEQGNKTCNKAMEQVISSEATSDPFVQINTGQNNQEKESCYQNESLGEVLEDITNLESVNNDTGIAAIKDSVSQPNSMVRQNSCPSVELDQLLSEEDEESGSRPMSANEDAASSQIPAAGKSVDMTSTTSSSLCSPIMQKPKRRLLPASSLLLRDMSSLDVEDKTEKPRGRRGGKKIAEEERKRTQGSSALLHLLKNNLHL